MEKTIKNKELISRLRKRYCLSEDIASDDEVHRMTDGTYGRAIEELDIVSEGMGGILREEILNAKNRMYDSIGGFIVKLLKS